MVHDSDIRDGRPMPRTWEEVDEYVAAVTEDLAKENKTNFDQVQILQALDFPVIRITPENTIIFFNNAFFLWGEFDNLESLKTIEETQALREQYWGKRSILELIPPEEHEHLEELKAAAYEKYFEGARFKGGVTAEGTFVSYKGTATSCRMLVTYSNVYKAYQVSFVDITEQKAAEEELRIARDEMQDRVEQAMKDLELKNQLVLEMSTPVVKLWEGIVMMPLIGTIDTVRAGQMTEALLESISHDDARVAVLDVTGIAGLDTSVARHIISAVEAARILGAEVIVTGFSPDAAQTLAQLGIDFASLRTRGSLRAGIQDALRSIGVRVGSQDRTQSGIRNDMHYGIGIQGQ